MLLVGFLVPILASAWLIFNGKGLDSEMTMTYWTGIERYQGVFVNPHNLGHSMALAFFIAVIYGWFNYVDRVPGQPWLTNSAKIVLLLVVVFGLFDLYYSFVRTTWFGMIIFLGFFTFYYSKKAAFMLFGSIVGVALLALPILSLVFFDFVEVAKGEKEADRIGSGRPYIWSHNIEIFKKLSFDMKLAGVGVGNHAEMGTHKATVEGVWNSHNDFLEVMMQTGIVGLLLFLFVQVQIFLVIRKLPTRDRGIFMALFLAVMFMNFSSNSYFSRFSIGQIFFMILAYVESRAIFNAEISRSQIVLCAAK